MNYQKTFKIDKVAIPEKRGRNNRMDYNSIPFDKLKKDQSVQIGTTTDRKEANGLACSIHNWLRASKPTDRKEFSIYVNRIEDNNFEVRVYKK